MMTIKLRRLSLQEAEEAIVTLWICLEEYGIPTPHIAFRFESPGCATISLRIDPEWDQVIKRRLAEGIGGACSTARRVETELGARMRLHASNPRIARSEAAKHHPSIVRVH